MILLYIYLLGVIIAFMMLTAEDIIRATRWIKVSGMYKRNIAFLFLCIPLNICVATFSWFHVYKELRGEVPHG